MKSLVIAEKPSVGRDIARVLKCGQKGGGYLEGGRYIVMSRRGSEPGNLFPFVNPRKDD